MAVTPEVSALHFQRELARAKPLAEAEGWKLEVIGDLQLRATIIAPASLLGAPPQYGEETYIFEFNFDNYREIPPLVDVVHPQTGERNMPSCFPTGGKGFFYAGSGRLDRICARWSRNAYGELAGPHSDWRFGDWASQSDGRSELGPILALLRNLLRDPSYQGRWRPQ